MNKTFFVLMIFIFKTCNLIYAQEASLFEEQGKYGLMDYENEEIIVPPIYDKIHMISRYNNYIKVEIANQKGLLSKTGKVLIDCIYDELFWDRKHFRVKRNGKWGIVDINGEIIVSIEYDSFERDPRVAIKNGKWGIIDTVGEEKMPFIYEKVVHLKSDYFLLKYNDNYGLIDSTYKEILPFNYSEIKKHKNTEALLVIKENKTDKFGIYNHIKEEWIVPLKIDSIIQVIPSRQHRELQYILVQKKGKQGIIDSEGRMIIRPKFKELTVNKFFIDGEVVIVKKRKKYGLLSFSNKKTKFKYDEISYIGFQRFRAKKNEKYGILSSSGKELTSFIYDDISYYFKDEKVRVEIGVLFGFIDIHGKELQKVDLPTNKVGFKSLEEMFKTFVPVLQSRDTNQIKAFCQKVVLDKYALDFMSKTGIRYRKMPNRGWSNTALANELFKEYYRSILSFCKRIDYFVKIEELEFVKIEYPHTGFITPKGRAWNTLYSETFVVYSTKSKSYRIKFGELLKIDGVWKSFTWPKLRSID